MSRRWNVFGALLGAMLLTLTGGSRTETRGTARLFDVVTAHGATDGVPVEPTDVFTPEDTPIYVSFRCDGCAIGMVITSSWWYLEREPPLRFGTGTETVETLEDFGEFHYDLAPGRRWSVGAYQVELRVDDVRAAQVPFRVAATRTTSMRRTADRTFTAPAISRTSLSEPRRSREE